jgi:hypothetical protein
MRDRSRSSYEPMLRIRKSINGEALFSLSGRIRKEHISELEALIQAEDKDRGISIDLKEVTLAGEDGITFLAGCESQGIMLVNCPRYIREWITRERGQG